MSMGAVRDIDEMYGHKDVEKKMTLHQHNTAIIEMIPDDYVKYQLRQLAKARPWVKDALDLEEFDRAIQNLVSVFIDISENIDKIKAILAGRD